MFDMIPRIVRPLAELAGHGSPVRRRRRPRSLLRASLSIAAGALLLVSVPALAEVKTGDVAPAVTLRDADNKLVFCMKTLGQKPVIVSFFFTDCKPCKKEIPELEKLAAKYGSRVQFYLVATDKGGADDVRPYVRRMAITIPVLIDQYQDTVQAYGITKYPSLFVIGRNGRVKYACFGYDPKNIEKIEQLLQAGL